VVTGGGLSLEESSWVSCRTGFFLSVRVLSRLFRRLLLQALRVAFEAGKLQFFGVLKPLRPVLVRAVLDKTAQAKPCPPDPRCVGTDEYNGFFGFGQVDAYAAVSAFGFDE